VQKRPTFARKAAPVVIATTPEGEQEVAVGEDMGEREEVGVEGTVRSRGGQRTNKTSTLRCYCLLSRFPFFELHFSVLYSVLGTLRQPPPSPLSPPSTSATRLCFYICRH
jgi:hypothetical protein